MEGTLKLTDWLGPVLEVDASTELDDRTNTVLVVELWLSIETELDCSKTVELVLTVEIAVELTAVLITDVDGTEKVPVLILKWELWLIVELDTTSWEL